MQAVWKTMMVRLWLRRISWWRSGRKNIMISYKKRNSVGTEKEKISEMEVEAGCNQPDEWRPGSKSIGCGGGYVKGSWRGWYSVMKDGKIPEVLSFTFTYTVDDVLSTVQSSCEYPCSWCHLFPSLLRSSSNMPFQKLLVSVSLPLSTCTFPCNHVV